MSSRALTERALARIAARQPILNAFRRVRTEQALAKADPADHALQRKDGGPERPLLAALGHEVEEADPAYGPVGPTAR